MYKIKCPKCEKVYSSPVDYEPIHLKLCAVVGMGAGWTGCWMEFKRILEAERIYNWTACEELRQEQINKLFGEFMGFGYWVKEVREKHADTKVLSNT